MPKSKKNAKKSAQAKSDFKKPKVKLGKKIAPANQTKVTYRSRGINMSAQNSLMDEKSDVAVTRRRVTIDELFGQLKHYNTSIRKDALFGLKELCISHPDAICMRIREILEATLKAVTDAERPVRHAVVNLYSKLLVTPPSLALVPFLKLIIMYAVQGLTHMQLSIRIDTLRFLELILQQDHLRSGDPSLWKSLIASLAQMLSVSLKPGAFSGNSSAATSPECRAAILRTLLALCASPAPESAAAGELLAGGRSVKWGSAREGTCKLQWMLYRQQAMKAATVTAVRLSLPSEGLPQMVKEMCRAFKECAEIVPQKAVHVEIMLSILQLTSSLAQSCGHLFADTACAQMQQLVIPHLPFSTVRPHTMRSSLCCALCAAVAGVAATTSAAAVESKDAIVQSTIEFIRELLTENPDTESSIDWDDHSHLSQILTSLSALTSGLPMSVRISCLDSLVQLSARLHRQSRAKSIALQAVCEWAQRVEPAPVQQLLAVLPKALWQLKAAHPVTSSKIIQTLFHFAAAYPSARKLLVNSLPPLLHVDAPNKQQAGTTKSVYGPVVKMSPEVQQRFLSILYYLPELPRPILRAVAAMLKHQELQPAVAEYAVEVVHSVRQKMAAEVYLSFAVSVVLNKDTLTAASLRVVLCLQRLAMGRQLGDSVMPLLAQVMQQPDIQDHQRVAATRLIDACCSGCTPGEAPVPEGASSIVAQILCRICGQSTEVVTALIMKWNAIWPVLLQELIRVASLSPIELDRAMHGLLSLMQLLEKLVGGPQLLFEHGAELQAAGKRMVVEAGEAGALASKAAELNALVQFVTK